MTDTRHLPAPPPPPPPPPAPAGGRHPVDIGHLVMGLAFLGLTGVWALFELGAVEAENVHWLLPWPWVLAGLAGMVASVVGNRRRREREQRAHEEYVAAYQARHGGTDTDTGSIDPDGPQEGAR